MTTLTTLLIIGGLLLIWLWKRHRAALLVGVATIAALYLAANSETAKAGATVVAFIGLAGLVFWLCSGSRTRSTRSATAHREATSSAERRRAATHEAFHYVTAEDLGYSPKGAWIGDNGSGATRVPDVADGRDHAIYAAAGYVGEGLVHNLFGGSGLRGVDRQDVEKHARLAGMTVQQVEREALRAVKRRSGRAKRIAERLLRDGRV